MAKKRRFKIKARLFVFLFILVGIVAGIVVLVRSRRATGTITYGDVNMSITAGAAVIRDESTVSTESYQKIIFHITEGEAVVNGTEIATVFKRGYQDESMVGLLRVQREIYEKQLTLLDESASVTLADINARIATVESQIRDTARGDSTLDMLTLENTLKSLQSERISYLKGVVTPDTELQSLYQELETQENTMNQWTRTITNSAGSGVISFYFDGYEKVLNASQLSVINAALINNVVSGGNTVTSSDSSSETPLYRMVSNTHWYLAFVTDGDSPSRTVAGEVYNVVFDDYSDQVYLATAIAPVVTASSVVNILEFNTDLGDFLSIRSVNITVTKAANGTIVPNTMVGYDQGQPYVLVKNGDSVVQVKVDVKAADEQNSVIEAQNAAQTLQSGMRVQEPEEEDDDD